MKVSSKKSPKKNPWKDALYGTYDGERGDFKSWQASFGAAWDGRSAEEIIDTETPWGILGIPTGSPQEVIKSAFRKLSKLHHPDMGGNPETFKKVLAAYYMVKE